MAAEIIELATDIVCAHAANSEMTSEQLMCEIRSVYAVLKGIEEGKEEAALEAPKKKTMTLKQAFKKDQVTCMVCGKTGLTTLKRHLTTAHNMKPGQYKKQFNIPKDQPLAAKDYVEKRRQMALDRGLAEKLAKAREAKKTKKEQE